jgi:hypothetical protein
MKIYANNVTAMLEIIEGLLHKGITFEVTPSPNLHAWLIELTGGF